MLWEIELGAVIGRPTRNATLKTAMDAIAGYTICHDVSARDLGRRADWPQFASDWFGQYEVLAKKGEGEQRDHDNAELVDRCHQRRRSKLQRAEIAEPGRAGGET